MGLKPIEVNRLTFKDFSFMEMGYYMREARELDRLRRLQATVMTFAGMGSSKLINPKDILSIPILDNENIIMPIRTREQALQMIDTYIKGEQWQN